MTPILCLARCCQQQQQQPIKMMILLSLQFSSESFSRVGYLNFQQRLSPPKFPYASFHSIKIEPKFFTFSDEPSFICRCGYLEMFIAEIKLTVSMKHANNNNHNNKAAKSY